jgi:phosphopantetheinyl transferase
MFHGPLFQGVTELTAIGDAHVRGVITTPPAPGALLDNVGQLLGYWIMATHEHRTVVFPVGMRRIDFYGPHPAPGTRLACHIRIRTIDEENLVADAQLTADGRVWAEFTGWADRRFGSHPDTRAIERSPGTAALASARPGGWFAVFDRWSDPASRDLRMRNYLGAAERDDYDACAPRGRAQWLLGRIAVKDAVRTRLWDGGSGPVYPAEVRVSNEASGRPLVAGVYGGTLPELDVSIAHAAECGVAIVRPGGPDTPGVGIDVECVVPRDKATRDFALSAAERELLTELAGGDTGIEDLWFTRFWTAKEATAKAEGTGLEGNPRRYAVVAATDTQLTVEVRSDGADPTRRYHVHSATLENPEDLPPRQYAVAWTEGPDRER